MKTRLCASLVLFASLTAGTASAALPHYAETIAPRGADAALTAEWHREDAAGLALLPVPAKGRLDRVLVNGRDAAHAAVTQREGQPVLLVPLEGEAAPAEIRAEWTMPGFYAPTRKTESDSASGRGDLLPLRYAIVNSTGTGFAEAGLAMALPEGMRLFQIEGKDAKFKQDGGICTVTRSVAGRDGLPGLPAGAKLGIDLSMVPPASEGPLILWAFVGIVSLLCLLLRRDLMPWRHPQEDER